MRFYALNLNTSFSFRKTIFMIPHILFDWQIGLRRCGKIEVFQSYRIIVKTNEIMFRDTKRKKEEYLL
jgi:hypothetical protein